MEGVLKACGRGLQVEPVLAKTPRCVWSTVRQMRRDAR